MSTIWTEPAPARRARKSGEELRVHMMDALSYVPYYTGHLSAALGRLEGLHITLASITYSHDPAFFRTRGIRNRAGALDITYRLPKLPDGLRRGAKLAECVANLAAHAVHLWRSRPDVLHVQFFPLVNYGLPFEEWMLDFARKLGIKIVYTVHNVLPQDTGERYRRVYERIYRGADRLICHDHGAARRLIEEFTIEPGRISVIPHGPLFQPQGPISAGPARRRLGFRDSECVVLWQGILRPYKGISFLLDAWRRVADLNTGARLAIVGTGEKDQIQGVLQGISERKLQDSVRPELRFVPVDELSDYYSAADILVYPYREITTSGALMTGINYGKAIVATVVPAFQKLLRDGENALLIPYGDPGALADCLVSLIRYPDLRSHLARAASRIPAAMNGWTGIARQTLDCYHAALSS